MYQLISDLSCIYSLYNELKNVPIMSVTWNTSGLCRCCHSEGNFKSLGIAYINEGTEEIFSVMLRDTFNINIIPMLDNVCDTSYSICAICEPRLRDAASFKQQVIACEEKFAQYADYSNSYKDVEPFRQEVKLEIEYTEGLKIESSNVGKDHRLKHKHDDSKLSSVEIFIEPSSDGEDQPLSLLRRARKTRTQRVEPEVYEDSGPEQDGDWQQREASDEDSKPIYQEKDKKYSCEICQKKFTYNGSLEVHMRLHNGEKTYNCYICHTSHINNKELTKHISENHCQNGTFPCNLCVKIFEKARLLKKHLLTHFEEKFTCTVCSKEFQRKKGLKEHLKTHTGEKKFTCNICNKSFGHNQTLKSHIYTHTGEKPYVCDVCGRRFPQRTHLKRHIYIIHNQIKPHTCSVCQKQFSNKSYLAIHQRQHTGERPYSCDVCKKDFAAYTTLKVHTRVHTGFKPYTCNFCSRQFAQMASFKLHQRTHTGEKPYSCKVCKKPFSDNGYLKIHMRVHSGEKPYTCDVCKRSFRETGQLKRHMRIHTGIKPYTCKICNKQIGNLSKHMRVHSDERPFNCEICNKQFSVNGNLKLHMRIHTGEKPFSCDLCSSQFTQSSGLKRHRCTHVGKGDIILPPIIKASYFICDDCIARLREASQFKRQIQICEQKFEEYCKNEQAQEVFLENIKVEWDFYEIDSLNMNTEVTEQNVNIEVKRNEIKHHKSSRKIKCEKDKLILQNNTPAIEYDPSIEVTIKSETGELHFCKICKYTFKTRNRLKIHILNKHTEHECQICSIKCKSKIEFNNHMFSHAGKQTYKCTKCDFIFMNKIKLLKHLKNHNTKCFICDICNKQFKYKSTIKLHMMKHMGLNKLLVCDLCGWKFNDSCNLNIHKRTVHEKLRIYECNVCNKSFSTKKNWKQHCTHHGLHTNNTCDICSKPFACMFSLKKHKLQHENKFLCKICKGIFLDKCAYLSHIRVQHRRKKELECMECSKMFSTKYCLIRHMDTHNGLKKFSCDVCLARFSQKSGLLKHKTRKHGTGKTICNICKKLVCDIIKHVKRTHSERTYKCGTCTKRFGDQDDLSRHLKFVHNSNGNFSCNICHATYKYKRGLSRHLTNVHGHEKNETDFGEERQKK